MSSLLRSTFFNTSFSNVTISNIPFKSVLKIFDISIRNSSFLNLLDPLIPLIIPSAIFSILQSSSSSRFSKSSIASFLLLQCKSKEQLYSPETFNFRRPLGNTEISRIVNFPTLSSFEHVKENSLRFISSFRFTKLFSSLKNSSLT
ncbi:hypothetical protein PAEPH01_2097 [Pancytospora epiphaga]|nr:hypothetical protein PAEPH01_2097 [Pancytospora epiphaga]